MGRCEYQALSNQLCNGSSVLICCPPTIIDVRYDLLRNETMYTGGEIILQIVRDVAQGLRFLHSSKPAILHGDLKAKNILIDSRFRAKVGDFGLALKSGRGLSGTPFW